MSTANLDSLYQALLSAPALPAAAQRRIAAYATEQQRWKLLVALLGREDLDHQLDRSLKKVRHATAAAAWVARPGRDVTELAEIGRQDRRAAVLAELAARTDLPEDVYGVLADRRLVTVDWALLSNPVVSDAVKVRAALNIGAGSKTYSGALRSEFTRLLGDHLDVHDQLVREATTPALMAAFAGSAVLSAAAREKIVDVVVRVYASVRTQLERSGRVKDADLAEASHMLEQLAEGACSPEVAERLLAAVTDDSGAALTHKNGFYGCFSLPKMVEQLRLLAAGGHRSELLRRARTSECADALHELAGRAAADKDADLARAVAENPASAVAAIGEVLALISPRELWVRVLRVRRDRFDDQVSILRLLGWRIDDEMLECTSDPAAALLLLIRQQRALPADKGHLPNSWVNSRYFGSEHAALLPISVVWDGAVDREARNRVSELLLTTFGDDDASWEVFEQFVSAPLDSVGDTVIVVQNLIG